MLGTLLLKNSDDFGCAYLTMSEVFYIVLCSIFAEIHTYPKIVSYKLDTRASTYDLISSSQGLE